MTPASSSPIPPDDLLAHAGFVRGLARALVSGDADVDDLVQETWLAALDSSGSRIRKPRSWLASIVRGRAARHHRTRARMDKRHAEGARPVGVPTPEDLAARREVIQRVSAAMAALPVPYHDVLVLRYYEDLPPREVARRLEIPVETARTRIRRGLARLREILDEKHDGERAAWAMPLAGLLSSGTATVGIGAVVAGGLAVLVLVLAGVVVVPRLWGGHESSRIQAPHAAERSPEPPVLVGRHQPEDESRRGGPDDAASGTEPQTVPEKEAAASPEDGEQAAAPLLLRVLDEDDRPVEGIEILERYASSSGGLRTRSVGRSDHDGVVRFVVPGRKVVLLTGENQEWHCGEVLVLPRDRQTPVFRMVRWITVQGIVLTIAGAPSVGTRVIARFLDRSGVEGVPNQAMVPIDPTDAEGRFTLRVPPYVRKVSLWTILREGGRATLEFDPQEQTDVTLQPEPLDSTPLIRGTVVDSGGDPVEDCLVQVLPLDGGRSMGGTWSKGVFSEMVSAPGRYLVLVTPFAAIRPARPEPMEVTAPADGIRIVCPPGAKLSGKLVGDDAGDFRVAWVRHRGPDPRLRVDDEVRSDESGAFALQGLADGDSLLFAYREADARYGLVERPRLDGDVLPVELRDGLSVSGRIVGYQGRHGFDLYVAFAWRGPTRYAQVEDDGTFRIVGLPPGSYRLGYWRGDLRGDLDLEIEAGNGEVEVIVPEEVLRMGQTPEK